MDDPLQNQMAMAALFAALVETLDEKTNGFTQAFLRHLDEMQTRLKEGGGDNRQALQPLAWTKALLREDLDRAEPASVVYAKDWSREDQLPSTDKVQLATLDEALSFWSRLPTFDRERASIETASGHRLDFPAITVLARRYKDAAAK